MATWTARGSVTLRSVVFTITAPTAEAAREKAAAGEYDDYDDMGAEMSDWTIEPATVKSDE